MTPVSGSGATDPNLLHNLGKNNLAQKQEKFKQDAAKIHEAIDERHQNKEEEHKKKLQAIDVNAKIAFNDLEKSKEAAAEKRKATEESRKEKIAKLEKERKEREKEFLEKQEAERLEKERKEKLEIEKKQRELSEKNKNADPQNASPIVKINFIFDREIPPQINEGNPNEITYNISVNENETNDYDEKEGFLKVEGQNLKEDSLCQESAVTTIKNQENTWIKTVGGYLYPIIKSKK